MDSSKRFRLRGNTMPKAEETKPGVTVLTVAIDSEAIARALTHIPDRGFFPVVRDTMSQDFIRQLYGVPEDDTFQESMRRERMGIRGRRIQGTELQRLQDYVFSEPEYVRFMLSVHSRDGDRDYQRLTSAPYAYAFACALLATGLDTARWRDRVVNSTMDAMHIGVNYGMSNYAPSFYPVLRDLAAMGLAGTRL
jgi:hypothetical protein